MSIIEHEKNEIKSKIKTKGYVMRYIVLSIFALLLLTACGESPTPTPNYPQISSDEAIALVHEHLQSIQIGTVSCLSVVKDVLDTYKHARIFSPSAIEQGDGRWQVTWSLPYYDVDWRNYQWTVYPITRTVMRTDNEKGILGGNVCP